MLGVLGGGGSHVPLGHHGPRCKLASLKAVWNAPQSPVEGALWVSRLYLVQVLGGMQVALTLVVTWWGAMGNFCCRSPARHLGSRSCSLEKKAKVLVTFCPVTASLCCFKSVKFESRSLLDL